jgi:hypothetical protein
MATPETISRFITFLSQAADLKHQQGVTFQRFKEFIANAKPVVVGELVPKLAALRPRIKCVCDWLVPDDLLAVAGLSYVENAYIELLSWALRPRGQDDIALVCQKAWLSSLRISEASAIQEPCDPQTQVTTKEGRPDLVLDYRQAGLVVVVEAKTGSDEHETTSGEKQTVTYPQAVRTRLGLPDTCVVKMVFLTPSGTSAENPSATNTTYAQFVMSLAEALSQYSLSPSLKSSYSMLFTHLLAHAAPNGTDAATAMLDLGQFMGTHEGNVSEDALLGILGNIRPALEVLTIGD